VRDDRAIIGVADHSGWAVLVTVASGAALLDRRRVELVDAELPCMPHHTEGQRLPVEQAVELVERVRGSAERHARRALDAVAADVSAPVGGIALRACPRLPATVAERLQDYWAQNRADGVMYREALAGAAEARGWRVAWYDAKEVFDVARHVLSVNDLDVHFADLRASIGPPWQKDHKLAMAAAIAASAGG
jgi:hypothetical protein